MSDPEYNPISRRRRLFLSVIINALFLLFLFLTEGVVRLTLDPVSPLELFTRTAQQKAQIADQYKVSIFAADPVRLWTLKPDLDRVVWDFTVVSTNARGLRYAETVAKKSPGTIRIVCLGDSVTFGYRVPLAWPERPMDFDRTWLPYPQLLENDLRRLSPGKKIEVIPLAVPGYSTHQGLAWLRQEIGSLSPDMVIMCFGWNDVSLSDKPDTETIPTSWLPVLARQVTFRSQTMLHLMRWMRKRQEAKALQSPPSNTSVVFAPRVSEGDYICNLSEIARLARTHNATPLVIGPVYGDKTINPAEGELMARYRNAARNAMAQLSIPYLEIRELTEDNYPATKELFGEKIHPNFRGHRLLAREILDFIQRQNLLPAFGFPAGADTASAPAR
ncbi:MAG: SGNH/GDSL hydrolase family protein [Blastocatellia bacterium]